MTPPDFEVHETGTRLAIDEKDVRIDRLERERRAMMFLLKYDEDELARAVEFFENCKYVPVGCAHCGGPTSVQISVEKSDNGNVPVVTCPKCSRK